MHFKFSDDSLARQARVEAFFRERILPRNHDWNAHMAKQDGTMPPFLETLKAEARAQGLWNMALPELEDGHPGTRLNNLEFAPRHSGKLFLTYDFGDNGLGFRAGGGVTASTHWWGDLQNTFLMPGYARLDGFASYTAELYGHRVMAQLNLQNINNVRYFEAVDDTFNFNSAPRFRIPARPFTAVGTLSFKW